MILLFFYNLSYIKGKQHTSIGNTPQSFVTPVVYPSEHLITVPVLSVGINAFVCFEGAALTGDHLQCSGELYAAELGIRGACK